MSFEDLDGDAARVFAAATGRDPKTFNAPDIRTYNAKRAPRLALPKMSGGEPDAVTEFPPADAGVFSTETTGVLRAVLILSALAITATAAVAVALVFNQGTKITAQNNYASYSDLVLRDPATGLICAQCDTGSGDIRISAGTVFLGDIGAALMPDTYTDSCMTCSSASPGLYGLDTHTDVPFVQDDYVPLDTAGNTVYKYGHTMQTAAGVAEDGAAPRAPYFVQSDSLEVRSGVIHFDRFAMGQACTGTTCDTSFEAMTDTPFAGPTAGFPDLCSATTTIPENSLYYVHRDMQTTVEFVGAASTLGATTGGRDMTFTHLCACITSPLSSNREQFCTSPLIGAYGGDIVTPGTPLV